MQNVTKKQLESLRETLIALKWMHFFAGNHKHIKILNENIRIVEQLESQLMDSNE